MEEKGKAYNLKLIADSFNKLSDYEKFIKTNKEYLDGVYNKCLDLAKNGGYSLVTSVTFRYNDPNKEHLIKYFKNLLFEVDLYEPGLFKGEKKEPSEEELKNAPYRYYMLMLSWKK